LGGRIDHEEGFRSVDYGLQRFNELEQEYGIVDSLDQRMGAGFSRFADLEKWISWCCVPGGLKSPLASEDPGTGIMNFTDGEIDGVIMKPLKAYHDARGWLVELFRHDELPEPLRPVMMYVSQTLPGVTRGPHEHVDQTDGFAFIGPSNFKLFLWDIRETSATKGHRKVVVVGASQAMAVWVPPGVVHAYRNVGTIPGLVYNAPNRLYAGWGKKDPVDEIRHEEAEPGRFPMD
jgi:dTDP-4-dehydrorhamnose 3,5-epimerase